ncbi:YtxH domain-containing protein [Alteribacillus iranensis]|uniref:Gas vesicle protein n=1 Tax=Alteribacillus iranensis TaxID=930128 RepID=A0A1I1Z4V2_9BACI|nr:YtxH domain-containing protein [Alteribacillus iranensis]SFE26582.1 Gas vesicle protein [Alteribacillus iranensis]
MDSKSLFTGIFAGALLGSLSALLFAPASGQETRATVRNFDWQSLKNKPATEEWQYAALEGFEAVENLTQEMKKTYSRYKEEVEPEVAAIQHQVRDISDAISELNERIRKGTS